MNQPLTLLDRPGTPPRGRRSGNRRIWSPWPAAGRPATAADEAAFAADLALAERDLRPVTAASAATHTRADTTAVLNALRGGLTLAALLDAAPGLRPERLHVAYAELEQRRRRAADAWSAIVAGGDVTALAEHGPTAAKLVPTVVARLLHIASTQPEALADGAARCDAVIRSQQLHVRRIEQVLDDPATPEDWATELGRLLYDPFGDAAANREDFIAERVGLLSPNRVAALLGERPAGVGLVPMRA